MTKKQLLPILIFVLLAIAVAVCLLLCHKSDEDNQQSGRSNTAYVKSNEKVFTTSYLSTDFVDAQLSDYEILGKWHVVGEDGYVICRKDGQLWSTYYDKEEQSVGVLVPLKERVENGDTIIYSEETISSEYFVIRSNGLYIYSEEGFEPYVWPVEK